jgi:hypothetical protein
VGRYWVDANVFIWGSREPFPLPGAEVYWNWFEAQMKAGKIISHWKAISEVVNGESKKRTEHIVQWVKSRKDKLVALPDSKECQELVGKMCQYSYDNFGSVKTAQFTRGADLWLIASARIDSGVVVTQENKRKPVRIPAICDAFEVRHVDLFQMNRELKMKLG